MSEKKELIRDLTTGSVPKTLLTFAMPREFDSCYLVQHQK